MMIFVFVFFTADTSTAVGDWSTIINPSPYVRISAMAELIISTDFACTFEPSLPPVGLRFKILCASSITVTWRSG